MLRQVDNFALACDDEATAKELQKQIGSRLRLLNKTEDPFTYLGLITDFNGIDVEQSHEYVRIACSNYINRIYTSHGWDKDISMNPVSKRIALLPMDILYTIGKQTGPAEGTSEHQALEDQKGFSYCTLLGEMMYAYVSCRPNIG